MSLRTLHSLFFAASIVLAAVSCKKDEETEVLPTLNGDLSFHVPEFVTPNQLVTMTPKGVSHPDGNGIGYYWKVTPGMEKADTTRLEDGKSPVDGKDSDGSFTYEFSDSLGTYNVSCYGFAKGYTSVSESKYVTVVKGGLDGSVTGTGIKGYDSHINVDEQEYFYISHNGLDWFRNNLALSDKGAAYKNATPMSDVFGRFYSYEEAMTACPEGWRLPTDKEWTELAASIRPESKADVHQPIPGIAADFMADVQYNQMDMWEYWPAVGSITNKSGMAMIPAGYANLGAIEDGSYPTAAFFGLYEYAAFWTADKVETEAGMAYFRYLICDQPDMQIGKGDIKTFGANVRCVRENK